MWKYIKWILLLAIAFFLGKAYGSRKKLVIYKDCTQLLEFQGVVKQR